jgi:hypothetical protein
VSMFFVILAWLARNYAVEDEGRGSCRMSSRARACKGLGWVSWVKVAGVPAMRIVLRARKASVSISVAKEWTGCPSTVC